MKERNAASKPVIKLSRITNQIDPDMIIGTAKKPEYIDFEGEYITLKKFQMQDVDALYEMTHGSEEKELIWQFIFHGPFKDKEDMRTFYKSYVDIGDKLVFCVHDKKSNTPMGVICLMNINTDTKNIELGSIWYAAQFQNREANTEAVYLLLNYCIYELGFRKMVWKCDNDNERSKMAAIRLGFEFEGLFCRHMLVKNKNRDTAWFGLIPEKWYNIKSNYEQWLNQDKSDRPSLLMLNSQSLQFSSVILEEKSEELERTRAEKQATEDENRAQAQEIVELRKLLADKKIDSTHNEQSQPKAQTFFPPQALLQEEPPENRKRKHEPNADDFGQGTITSTEKKMKKK